MDDEKIAKGLGRVQREWLIAITTRKHGIINDKIPIRVLKRLRELGLTEFSYMGLGQYIESGLPLGLAVRDVIAREERS